MIRISLAIFAILFAVAAAPFMLVALAFRASDGSWDFEGDGNLRYWLFVRGSRLEKFGVVTAAGPVRYSIRFQEGTFPGWNVAQYDSAALPEAILETYAGRCRAMGLKITEKKLPLSDRAPNMIAGTLVCEIEPYLDAEFFAGRRDQATATQVGIKIWGDK